MNVLEEQQQIRLSMPKARASVLKDPCSDGYVTFYRDDENPLRSAWTHPLSKLAAQRRADLFNYKTA